MTIEQSFPQALAGIADGFQIMDLVSRNVVWLVRGGQARAVLKVQKGRKVSLIGCLLRSGWIMAAPIFRKVV